MTFLLPVVSESIASVVSLIVSRSTDLKVRPEGCAEAQT